MIRLKRLILEAESPLVPITTDEAEAMAQRLGVAGEIDIEELRRGMEVEQEHLNTVKLAGGKSDSEVVAMIALDHLREYGDYYTRLKKVED